MGIERRLSTRYITDVPASFRFPTGKFKEGWGRITNISSTGIGLETRFPLKLGTILYVSFALKDGISFDNLRAHVIRAAYSDGYYLGGIQFDDVVDQQTLRDVLLSLAADGGMKAL